MSQVSVGQQCIGGGKLDLFKMHVSIIHDSRLQQNIYDMKKKVAEVHIRQGERWYMFSFSNPKISVELCI